MQKQVTVKVPGSCGELVQGVINSSDFLITCPVNLYSSVTVELEETINRVVIDSKLCKTKKALQLLLDYYRLEIGVRVQRRSELKIGMGMASSTADITAACAALMKALGRDVDPGIIAKIALAIEPTDGTFFSGINLFDHRQGSIRRFLGYPPPLEIIMFSENGTVNTLDFNSRPDLEEKNLQKKDRVAEAVKLVKKGLETGCAEMIGRGATISSKAHQAIIFRSYLEQLLQIITLHKGIYGLNIAHSGTVIGILVKPEGDYTEIIEKIENEIPALAYLGRTRMIAGGLKIDDRTYTRR